MKDIILARLAALLEEKIDPKLRAERLKRKSKAYDNRVHKNYTAQPRDEDPPPSDDELKDMAKHYGEAKELNPTSFQPDVASGLNKLMAGVNARKKQRAEAEAKAKATQPVKKEESTNLKDRMVDALMEARGDMLVKHTNKKVAPERARDMEGSVYQEKGMQAPGVVANANKLRAARAKMKAPPAPEPKPASGRTYVTKRSDYGDNTYRGDSD